jgi:glycogen debranching enzyme
VRPDGSTPSSPLADADSQAAAVAALRALTRLDPTHAQIWRNELSALRARVSSTFGPEVLAVDAADEPVAGAGSQLGWLLWADALDEQAAAAAMRRLTAGDVLTPYGLRTLSMQAPAFVADGYHRGAVWPFDNWLGWGGLRAAGDAVGAEQVRVGVRRALAELGRYPELYAVDPGGALARVDIANRVQAWTIGAAVAFDEGWDGRTW